MQRFLDHIQKSIYGPEYYRELVTKPASFSWKYYWSFTMLMALFMTVVTSLPLVPIANNAIRQFPVKFFAYYPDELEVKVIGGQVSANVPQPYFLPLPPEWNMGTNTPGGFAYLGVIDTTTPVTLDAWRGYHSIFWLAKDSLVVSDENGGVRITTLGAQTNLTVNERELHRLYDMFEPYLKFIAPLIVVAIFFAMLVSFTVNLFYLLFVALFILLLGRVMHEGWNYGTSYRIALHATTLPLLITALLAVIPSGTLEMPFFSAFAILAVVFINFRKSAVVTPPTAPVLPPQ